MNMTTRMNKKNILEKYSQFFFLKFDENFTIIQKTQWNPRNMEKNYTKT